MTEILIVKTQCTTLSALLARHYRKVFAGMAARKFALNQDLKNCPSRHCVYGGSHGRKMNGAIADCSLGWRT